MNNPYLFRGISGVQFAEFGRDGQVRECLEVRAAVEFAIDNVEVRDVNASHFVHFNGFAEIHVFDRRKVVLPAVANIKFMIPPAYLGKSTYNSESWPYGIVVGSVGSWHAAMDLYRAISTDALRGSSYMRVTMGEKAALDKSMPLLASKSL